MRILRLFLVLCATLLCIETRANGDDGHQFPHIEEQDAILYGLWFIEQFVAQGEIDTSWQADNLELEAELLELVTGPEWVVTAANELAPELRRIRIFFGPMGQYLGWEPVAADPPPASAQPRTDD